MSLAEFAKVEELRARVALLEQRVEWLEKEIQVLRAA